MEIKAFIKLPEGREPKYRMVSLPFGSATGKVVLVSKQGEVSPEHMDYLNEEQILLGLDKTITYYKAMQGFHHHLHIDLKEGRNPTLPEAFDFELMYEFFGLQITKDQLYAFIGYKNREPVIAECSVNDELVMEVSNTARYYRKLQERYSELRRLLKKEGADNAVAKIVKALQLPADTSTLLTDSVSIKHTKTPPDINRKARRAAAKKAASLATKHVNHFMSDVELTRRPNLTVGSAQLFSMEE